MRHPSKNVNMNTIKFCEEFVFLILNFVKRPFSSCWILRRVRFSHVKFCEESIFLMLNFVNCPKTDSIFPLDRLLANDALRHKSIILNWLIRLLWMEIYDFYCQEMCSYAMKDSNLYDIDMFSSNSFI